MADTPPNPELRRHARSHPADARRTPKAILPTRKRCASLIEPAADSACPSPGIPGSFSPGGEPVDLPGSRVFGTPTPAVHSPPAAHPLPLPLPIPLPFNPYLTLTLTLTLLGPAHALPFNPVPSWSCPRRRPAAAGPVTTLRNALRTELRFGAAARRRGQSAAAGLGRDRPLRAHARPPGMHATRQKHCKPPPSAPKTAPLHYRRRLLSLPEPSRCPISTIASAPECRVLVPPSSFICAAETVSALASHRPSRGSSAPATSSVRRRATQWLPLQPCPLRPTS